MVVPASIAPTFEVVEPELSLHVCICALCPPALLDVAYELFDAEVFGKGCEVELASERFVDQAPTDLQEGLPS